MITNGNDYNLSSFNYKTDKLVTNIFEIICIFTAPKNHTSKFADTPIDPDCCKSLKVVPHCNFQLALNLLTEVEDGRTFEGKKI